MLTPRLLSSCAECTNILTIIEEIDCKIAKLAGNLYFNMTLMLNKPVTASTFDLLFYRRILLHKYMDEDYCSNFSVTLIASRVKKLLKFK